VNERHGTREKTVIIARSSVADRRTFTSLSVPIVKRVPSSLATIASRHDNIILLPPSDIISAVDDYRLIWRRRTHHFRPSPLVTSFCRRSRCIAIDSYNVITVIHGECHNHSLMSSHMNARRPLFILLVEAWCAVTILSKCDGDLSGDTSWHEQNIIVQPDNNKSPGGHAVCRGDLVLYRPTRHSFSSFLTTCGAPWSTVFFSAVWIGLTVFDAYVLQRLSLSSHFVFPIDRVKWRHISMVAIRSPFCRSTPSYCASLSGEDLSRYSNKIESVGLRKYPYI